MLSRLRLTKYTAAPIAPKPATIESGVTIEEALAALAPVLTASFLSGVWVCFQRDVSQSYDKYYVSADGVLSTIVGSGEQTVTVGKCSKCIYFPFAKFVS